MNLAITLVIQGVVFFLVAWAVMKFFWPAIMNAIETRQKKIAEGLAAASKSEQDLAEAEARSKDILREGLQGDHLFILPASLFEGKTNYADIEFLVYLNFFLRQKTRTRTIHTSR